MRKPQPIEIGILLALNTGLRIGELCALQRQDIDFTAGTVSVRNTAQRINYGGRTKLVVQTPKSAASNRVIPIPAEMLVLLRQYVYAFAPGRYLFSGNPARPLEPRTCQRHFKALRDSLSELPQYAPHLRHALCGGGGRTSRQFQNCWDIPIHRSRCGFICTRPCGTNGRSSSGSAFCPLVHEALSPSILPSDSRTNPCATGGFAAFVVKERMLYDTFFYAKNARSTFQ